MARQLLYPDAMSSKRRGSKENRARLTLRRERLRNLSVQVLAKIQGGVDPMAGTRPSHLPDEVDDGGCRYSK